MVKFAHLADVHLGGWRQPEMQKLSFESFQFTVNKCIERKLDFILIAGDLFDSAYPSIEILKDTFSEFRKLKEARIPVFIIAGSHDYSVSGKSFLDVLEQAGFCKNVHNSIEKDGKVILSPHIHEGIALYGYPGKKSGIEVQDLKNLELNEAPGMMKIVMLHTTLDKVRGVMDIECLEADRLPPADYYALGHIHVDFRYKNIAYPGPVFPTNFSELETLHNGTFFLIDTESNNSFEKIDIKIKDIETMDIRVKNTRTATDEIIAEAGRRKINNKVVLLRLSGELNNQKTSDINFQKIEDFMMGMGAYYILRNTHDLTTKEPEFDFKIKNNTNIEIETVKKYSEENPSKFNSNINKLLNILSTKKQEGETLDLFNKKLINESNRIFEIK